MNNLIDRLLASGDETMTRADFEFLTTYGETNRVERKSNATLSTGGVAKTLTKPVSAFANYDGGVLLIGVDDDDGTVEPGVPDVKGKGTIRDWVGSLVDGNVSPRLTSYAVKRVKVDAEYAFAIVVGSSDQAPHQASDNRYYCRLDGSSHSIDGRMVKDIFQRQSYANLEVELAPPPVDSNGNSTVNIGVKNTGRVCADAVAVVGTLESDGKISGSRSGPGCMVKALDHHRVSVQANADIIYPDMPQGFQNVVTFKGATYVMFTGRVAARNQPVKNFNVSVQWSVAP